MIVHAFIRRTYVCNSVYKTGNYFLDKNGQILYLTIILIGPWLVLIYSYRIIAND